MMNHGALETSQLTFFLMQTLCQALDDIFKWCAPKSKRKKCLESFARHKKRSLCSLKHVKSILAYESQSPHIPFGQHLFIDQPFRTLPNFLRFSV